MISSDTPLVEVVSFLEARTAQLLVDLPYDQMEIALHAVRHFLMVVESKGVTLDPITLGTELHQLVEGLVGGVR